MKGGGGRLPSPHRGLGSGHGGVPGCCSALCSAPQHPSRPRVPREAVPSQGDRTQEDPILRGPFGCGCSPAWGSPSAGVDRARESSGISGSPVQPCVAQMGGIIHFLR